SFGIGSLARFTTRPTCSRAICSTRSRFIAPYEFFTISASSFGPVWSGRAESPTVGNAAVNIAYLCQDLGVPVLGRKGASAHVRGVVGALTRAGHRVILMTPAVKGSPWEEPADVDAQLLHVPPGAETENVFGSLKTLNVALGVQNTLPGELRRILYNQDLAKQLLRRFESAAPDVIYERASLYATAGVTVGQEL